MKSTPGHNILVVNKSQFRTNNEATQARKIVKWPLEREKIDTEKECTAGIMSYALGRMSCFSRMGRKVENSHFFGW